LLQIRTLLIAQQQLQAAQAQLQQDREARGHALSEYLTSGRITDRGPRPWW
jgi:conjugal transfer/entry exclusion protein